MQPQSGLLGIGLDDSILYAEGATTSGKVGTDSNSSFNLFYCEADKIILDGATGASTTIGIGETIPIYLFKIQYLKVFTSNIFKINLTIDTATSGTTTRVTIGSTAGTSCDITTITITIITITIATIRDIIGTTTIITFTIETIYATTITTNAINKIINDTSDTGGVVSKFIIRGIRARAEGATMIQIIIANNTQLHGSELAE